MELILLDKNLNVSHAPIDDFLSLTWQKKWTECGSFSLYLSDEYFEAVKGSRYLYQSEDQATAIIENIKYTDNSGKTSFYVKGRDLNALLYNCIIPKTETLRGNLEVKIRNLVKKYAINDATQKIPKLALGPLQKYTESIDTQVTGLELGEALYTLLNPYGMSWRLRYDFEKDIIYFEIIKGKDRTQDQNVNTWATFSTSRENIQSTEYTYNDSDYKNFAYVAGAGSGKNRTIVEVDETHGEKVRALYVDARDLQKDDDDETKDCFIIAANDGKIMRSIDGNIWAVIDTPATGRLYAASYENGRFFAGGENSTLLTSKDGAVWEKKKINANTSFEDVVYHDGLYIAIGNDCIAQSYDANSWTISTGIPGAAARYFRNIIYGNGQYVMAAVSNYLFYSEDGFTWRSKKAIPTGSLLQIFYRNGLYLACGYNGMLAYSFDTDAWKQVETGTTNELTGIAYGNGRYVIVGKGGTILSSEDGTSWTARISPVSADLTRIAYGFGKFIAVSWTATLISTDGITWEAQAASPLAYPNNIVFGTDYYKYTLRLRGLKKLGGCKKVDEVSGIADDSAHPVYGIDYSLGDVCDFENNEIGISFQERITGVEFVYEPRTARKITPTFGTSYLSMKNFIKREANQ